MSSPIPISPSSPSGSHKDAFATPSSASASSSGLSPHTPFTPLPPTITPASVGSGSAANGQQGGTGLLRWASLSFGKSPTSPGPNAAQFPSSAHQGSGHGQAMVHGHDHDHDEHHDVFEFGDFNHMAKGSWTGHGRRAASMSMASGANAARSGANEQSLSALFAGGFNGMPSPTQETAPGSGQGMAIPRQAGALTAGSPPGPAGGAGMRGGVVADNAAKGVGVLRRLSLSGSLTRPSFLSPTGGNAPLPPAPGITASSPSSSASAMGQPQASALTNAKPTVPAPNEGGGGLRVPLGQRGRRYSENSAKKRGVSPMGERILRDHGGF